MRRTIRAVQKFAFSAAKIQRKLQNYWQNPTLLHFTAATLAGRLQSSSGKPLLIRVLFSDSPESYDLSLGKGFDNEEAGQLQEVPPLSEGC